LAALDRLFPINAAVDVCSIIDWPKSGVTGAGRGTGAVGVFSAFDIAHSNDYKSQGRSEDQEILAKLIAPIAPAQAQRISKDLIRDFGTLPRVFAAFENGAQHSIMPANVSNYLRILKHLLSRLLRLDVSQDPILSSTDSVLAYLHNEMSHLERETLRVLFLDAGNRLIHEQVMWEGTISSVQLHPREIIHVALQRHACALILVHNHPSGNPAPSKEDICVTHALCTAATFMGIEVHDHLIVSSSGHYSMSAEGILYPNEPNALTGNSQPAPVSFSWRTWLGF
jgi:DNA repair protein RadC